MTEPKTDEDVCTRSTTGMLHCPCVVCLSLREEWADDGAEEWAEANRWSY